MHPIFKRSFSILLALVLCLNLLTGITLPAANASTTVEYQYGSTSQYSKFSNIIKNWGKRGETATFLSPNAQNFYTDNNISYSALASLSGSNSIASVPVSALYLKLQALMTDNHTTLTNYGQTRDLYPFLDCQENNTAYITCLYCGKTISSAWDQGATWQREHTWPKSKSLNGTSWNESAKTDETDITMLRPACPSCNGSRSNIAYGDSSGYFMPNAGDVDVRGDAARSILYGYVRWGNTNYMWGTNGVMESDEVLLKWMEEDPVDTWEMGRNDSLESITGARNVFIDYPELAFLMFGAEIPEDYSSPSGGSSDNICAHTNTTTNTTNATCTENGSSTVTCSDCGAIISTTVIEAAGHSYINGTCSGCGIAQPGTDGNAGDYVFVTPETATAGKYIIGAVRSGAYPTIYPATSAISGDWTVSSTSVTASNDIITSASLPADAQVVTLTGDNANGFTVGFEVNGTMQYLGYTSTTKSRTLALDAQYSSTLWKIVADPDSGVALASSYGEKSYTISQNSTGSTPIRGYYTGIIYTGIYLFRQVDAAPEVPKVAQVGDVQYESFADAYAAANDQPIKLLANLGSNTDYYTLALTKDVTIDLNGYFAYISATGAHTLYGMDSMTTDYTIEEYGTLYVTGATVAAADGYLALNEGTNAHSFHAYEFAITHIRLQPNADALGFKAQLKGDYRILAASGYGFHMGAQLNVTKSTDGAPTDGIFTLRLKNIMAVGGGEATITASAFVVIEGQTLTTQVQTTSMKDTVIAVNNMWASLSTTQQDAVKALYNQHSATMAAWLGDDNKIA